MKSLPELYRSVAHRAAALAGLTAPIPAALEMIWPEARLDAPPAVTVPAGYALRQFRSDDINRYWGLIEASGMPRFELAYWEKQLLPGGFFIIEHEATCQLAATCMALHRPAPPRHPFAGCLGWLAADPAHKGKQLGRAAAAAVTATLIARQYRKIYLDTQDFRIAAIKVYLTLGWVPLVLEDGMHSRWKVVCANIGWPYTPEQWAG